MHARRLFAVAGIAVVLCTSACEATDNSSTSGGTSGGNSNGGVQETSAPPLHVDVTKGSPCQDGGTITVKVSGADGATIYSVNVRFPVNTHQERTVKTLTIEANGNGVGFSKGFTCKGLKKGSYGLQVSDLNTGARGKDFFDVLR
jgi:hypothetical protein